MSKIVANNISPRSGDTVSVTGGLSATGNVSVGGTLTYEDVTNIDSVGMVTARKGIQVLADGINAVGVVTATSFSGTVPSSNLSGALPAIDGSALTGIQVGTRDFVGYGTNITVGKPVGLGSDGTVRAIFQEGDDTPTLGSSVDWETTGAIRFTNAAVYDTTNDKVFIAFADYGDSSQGKALIGDVNASSESVTFGTATLFSSSDTRFISCAYDPNQDKFIVFYARNGSNDYLYYQVGSYSGTNSITWSSSGETALYSNGIQYNVAIYDTTNNKINIIWNNQGNELRSCTGGVNSDDTLTLGSTVEITSDNPDTVAGVFYASQGKMVIVYRNSTQNGKGYYTVGSYTATNSATWSTPTTWNTDTVDKVNAVYDSNVNRMVVLYRDTNNSNYGTAVVGSLSGTTMTWGTPVVFNTGDTEEISSTFDSTSNKVIISYKDIGDSNYTKVIVGTVGGSNNRSISFDSEISVNNTGTTNTAVVYDPDQNRSVVFYNDGTLNGTASAKVLSTATNTTTNLTAENYIGLAAAGISSGSTGTITIPGGISSGHTGLTTGRTYYVQPDGTLATSAGSPQVVAGTSISATEILVR